MVRMILLAVFAVATAVWAQDPAPESEAPAESETVEEAVDDEFEDLELDSQEDHTEEDEDVFTPTDVVSFDQSVPFPVDI